MKFIYTFLFIIATLGLKSQNPKIIAHRGASGYCPENTISSVKKALEIGVDLVEIDVHLSKDGEVVVIHDETIDRTTNGEGLIADYTLEELKKLDAGTWFGEDFEGEQIPTFREVLELCNGNAILLIEVKKGKGYYENIEAKCWQIIQELGAEDWVEFQSFYDYSLVQMELAKVSVPKHKLLVGVYPGLPIYVDQQLKFGNYFNKNEIEVDGVNPNLKFVSKAFLNKLNEKSLSTYVWTVNELDDMQKLIDCGVDGIITNYPKELKELINE